MSHVQHLLGLDGPLARTLSGYEHRRGQLDMAGAVERAIDEDRVLLCEAGTGTGKTLAYLLPALLSKRKVVVSTASKALQEQIFTKDLPLIEEHLDLSVDAELVKGLGNYVCQRRLYQLRSTVGPELWQGADRGELGEIRAALPIVEDWVAGTTTGDIAEVTELSEAHPIWREITSSSESRIGPSCSFHETCFITRLRRRAEEADLLVVNHHLFFADLAIKGDHPGGVLPPYDVVVLDEAHRIEDTATSFFGTHVSSAAVERLLRDAERALRSSGVHDDPRRPPTIVAQAAELAQELFQAVKAIQRNGDGRQPLGNDIWDGELLDTYHALDDTLAALESYVATGATDDALRAVSNRIRGVRESLSRIVEPDGAQVTWCERRARSVGLAASPVSVAPMLQDRLFEQGYAMVLTSASLSTSGSFDFVRSRLGLQELSTAPVDELIVESPFDFRRRALLYTPTDLPDVPDDDFVTRALDRLLELLEITRGGAFVLCTSVRNMDAIADGLDARSKLTLLRQGEAPKSALLGRFRRAEDAVLVATMSFWEGVDVPGEALRLVVMDRLPFAVPTDPLVQARCRAVEEAGSQPFATYSLPGAAIVLKQGFGRLLRTREDYGVVAVLDRRIRTKGYGRALLASLPPVTVTDELTEVARFWTDVAHHAAADAP